MQPGPLGPYLALPSGAGTASPLMAAGFLGFCLAFLSMWTCSKMGRMDQSWGHQVVALGPGCSQPLSALLTKALLEVGQCCSLLGSFCPGPL